MVTASHSAPPSTTITTLRGTRVLRRDSRKGTRGVYIQLTAIETERSRVHFVFLVGWPSPPFEGWAGPCGAGTPFGFAVLSACFVSAQLHPCHSDPEPNARNLLFATATHRMVTHKDSGNGLGCNGFCVRISLSEMKVNSQ